MSKAKAMARIPQSEPLDRCPTSIILTLSSDAGLNTREAMSCTVLEETEGYMLSVINYTILISNIRNDTPVAVVNMKDLYKIPSMHIKTPHMLKCRWLQPRHEREML